MTITNAPTPVSNSIAEAVAGLALTREQACQLVIQGFNNINAGILHYHKLGLGLTELYEDLKEAGWDKSKRTLQRAAAVLRGDGLLPETNQGARTDLVQQQSGSDMLSPQNLVGTTVMERATTDEPEERLFSVTMVQGLQNREIELMQENEQLKEEVQALTQMVGKLKLLLAKTSVPA